MLGQPLFPGESGIDQLVEIIKVLGTPTREQIRTMNPNYMEHKFPQIKPHPFNKVFSTPVPPVRNGADRTRFSVRRHPRLLTSSPPFWNTLRLNGCPRWKLCAIPSSMSCATRTPGYRTRATTTTPLRISPRFSISHNTVQYPALSYPALACPALSRHNPH